MIFQLLDLFFTLLHVVIIGFNLLGWIWPQTRMAHFICVLLTAFSWFILGIFYGIGYCPITDWHWQVKGLLGESNLPNSFIEYYADKLSDQDIDTDLIDLITVLGFMFSLIMALYFKFRKRV